MVDFYRLISRAVAGLDTNTGVARRTVYDLARAALLPQLSGANPSGVTKERQVLEEAIREVEAESIRKSLAELRATQSKPRQRPPDC